jgi:cardiolipin synthase
VVVIDGKIGYTGGFGLDDKWYGDGRHEDQWRDTNVRFTGPAVMQLQATFADGWCEPTGELLTGDLFFPVSKIDRDGPAIAGVVHAAPTIGSTIAERLYALSIVGAKRTLYLSNAYFVPDDDFRRMLTERAKKGVDVRILTAGEKGDVKSTWYAGRGRYEELLEAGVRIFEYRPTMMHAKTLVVDGSYIIAGTMNFDNRSMAFNDETVLITMDKTVGARANEMFLEDMKYADEIDLATFRNRPKKERILENMYSLFSRIL